MSLIMKRAFNKDHKFLPHDDGPLFILGHFERGLGGDKRFGSPLLDQLIDLLLTHEFDKTKRER